MNRPAHMNTPGARTRFCATCERLSDDDIPDGWYQISVTDSRVERTYRYLGLYCSMSCLAAAMPRMSAVEAEIKRRGGMGGVGRNLDAINRERRRNGLPAVRA